MKRPCTAHRSNGEVCLAQAMRGGNVCRVHGGSSPQAKLKAELRLALMVDPILSEMYRIAVSGETDSVRLAAGRDLLDRAGLKPTEHVQQDGKLVIEIEMVDRVMPALNEAYAADTAT